VNEIMTLISVPEGGKAVIQSIRGGRGLMHRLSSLGIREGKEIIKVSSGIARGPVVLRCGSTEVAIGFGMAQKILVRLL
jgi:ferrous iron transport protein A